MTQRLERACVELDREELPVLVQVDLAGEQNKSGIDSAGLPRLLDEIKQCRRVSLIGLMILPPYFEDPECTRPFFKALYDLRDELKAQALRDRHGELRGKSLIWVQAEGATRSAWASNSERVTR